MVARDSSARGRSGRGTTREKADGQYRAAFPSRREKRRCGLCGDRLANPIRAVAIRLGTTSPSIPMRFQGDNRIVRQRPLPQRASIGTPPMTKTWRFGPGSGVAVTATGRPSAGIGTCSVPWHGPPRLHEFRLTVPGDGSRRSRLHRAERSGPHGDPSWRGSPASPSPPISRTGSGRPPRPPLPAAVLASHGAPPCGKKRLRRVRLAASFPVAPVSARFFPPHYVYTRYRRKVKRFSKEYSNRLREYFLNIVVPTRCDEHAATGILRPSGLARRPAPCRKTSSNRRLGHALYAGFALPLQISQEGCDRK